MLTDFFLRRKIADLIRRSRDNSRMDQYTSIVELGRLPPSDESVACLIQHTREPHTATAIEAIRALGLMNDHRATDQLVRLLREDGCRTNERMVEALGRPHHLTALPALAEIARAHCLDYKNFWLASGLIDLMRRIDPFASQPHIEALAPIVLASALRELQQEKPADVKTVWAETILAQCQDPAGLKALQNLQEHLVLHHRQILMTAGRLGDLAQSLEWLRKSSRPAAATVVAEFLRTPSRRVITSITRDVSDDDSPGARYESFDEPAYTSELGQPPSAEELSEREEKARAQVAYQDAAAQRRHRENVYPVLLDHGSAQDLSDYAQACLTNPQYDLFTRDWRSDAGTPKINRLANYLRRARDNVKAGELLRLVMAGDRTRLWASARQALAWRGDHVSQIDWQPLAVELLEMTGDPAVDALLISLIETSWANRVSTPLMAMLERRDAKVLIALAERFLLGRTSIGGPDDARQIVLKDPATALRVAKELHRRSDWGSRSEAWHLLSSVAGPEAEAELGTWIAGETTQSFLDTVERMKGIEFVKRCQAAAARPAAPQPSAMKAESAPATDAPPDHDALWARIVVCLGKRKAMPPGTLTPGEVARHADAILGHHAVSRFVYEYYYPAVYDQKPVPAAALAWVEQFERSSG